MFVITELVSYGRKSGLLGTRAHDTSLVCLAQSKQFLGVKAVARGEGRELKLP